MFTSRCAAGALVAALVMLLVVPCQVVAQDADTQEVMSYSLSETGLANYTQATRNLVSLPDGRPGACDEDDDSDAQSIAEIVAQLEQYPGARAAVESAGMTPREYVVFGMALVHNGVGAWALEQPGGVLPPGLSRENVEFIRGHAEQMQALGKLMAQSDCGYEDADEDSE